MSNTIESGFPVKREKEVTIKCVVWDLDNTIWHGVLLEGDQVRLNDSAMQVVKTLDMRGILQSIASKNDYSQAVKKLQEFGLEEYFLYPQINWNSKSSSIQLIAKSLNIATDAVAFIDDQAYELAEVKHSLPEVMCVDAIDIEKVLGMPVMNPRLVTEDARRRRHMYAAEVERQKSEAEFTGPKEEFLATLAMELTISRAQEGDLLRAEELSVRTNQLNTTGRTYSYAELDGFRQSQKYKLLMASLDDKFGSYGKIGLALIESERFKWTIKLLLMSCRVMSRGVGTVMINHIMRLARMNNVVLQAEFIPNERNRMMYITYKFAGFKEIDRVNDMTIMENDLSRIQPFPEYVRVNILD
jgi:FkbH-like protein